MRRRTAGLIAALVAVLVALTGCETDGSPEAQAQERERQQNSYERLTAAEPAHEMQHPVTRRTVNFWIDTWDEPGKLSYVYLQSANGDLLGYYILEGLPVSYCVSLTPNYRIETHGSGTITRHMVPAPSVDGVYYGGSGSCDTYYGKDASTGAYIEYTAGLGINVLLYDQPLPRQDVEPLGFTRIGEENRS